MNNLYAILIDILILSALGFLYYFFQKKRILKRYSSEIIVHLSELISMLENIKLKEESKDQAVEINSYLKRLKAIQAKRDIFTSKKIIENYPHNINDEVKEQIEKILLKF